MLVAFTEIDHIDKLKLMDLFYCVLFGLAFCGFTKALSRLLFSPALVYASNNLSCSALDVAVAKRSRGLVLSGIFLHVSIM